MHPSDKNWTGVANIWENLQFWIIVLWTLEYDVIILEKEYENIDLKKDFLIIWCWWLYIITGEYDVTERRCKDKIVVLIITTIFVIKFQTQKFNQNSFSIDKI